MSVASPTVYYHAYDHNHPSGGQKDTYQHVDVLNSAGIEAYVVHGEPGFRLSWFKNHTAVLSYEEGSNRKGLLRRR